MIRQYRGDWEDMEQSSKSSDSTGKGGFEGTLDQLLSRVGSVDVPSLLRQLNATIKVDPRTWRAFLRK